MAHIPYHTEDDTPASWHPDGSGIDTVFAERDALRVEVERLRSERIEALNLNASQAQKIARSEMTAARYLTSLQQIAAAGPMTTDDWRWKVAQDAIKSAHVNKTLKPEHDREDVLTEAVSDDDVSEIFGAPV